MSDGSQPEKDPPNRGEGSGQDPRTKHKPASAEPRRGKEAAGKRKAPRAEKAPRTRPGTPPRERGSAESTLAASRTARSPCEPVVVQKISLTDIDATDRSCQCRFAGWSHADLKESMGAHGQHEPIHLRGEKPPYTIVDGFRRHAAAVDLEWDAIDAFVHGAMPDMQAKHLAFSSNVARKNLSLLEKINAMYLAEHEYGLSREAQAEVFGVSIRTIDRWHQLCAFPEHIRKIVDCGEITVAHGKHLSDFKVRNAKKWAERIRTEGLTGRGLKNLLARERGPQTGGRPRQLFITKKNKLEVRALTLSLHATPAEKEALIEELMKLIDAIKDSMGEDPDDFGMAELDQE